MDSRAIDVRKIGVGWVEDRCEIGPGKDNSVELFAPDERVGKWPQQIAGNRCQLCASANAALVTIFHFC